MIAKIAAHRRFTTIVGSGCYQVANSTNQVIVLKPNLEDGDICPVMQLRFQGPKIRITNEMTLRDLSRILKENKEASSQVEFFDEDGSRLSFSSKMKNVLEINNFRMHLDGSVYYRCYSAQAFGESISMQTPQQHKLHEQFKQLGIKDLKARSLAKLVNSLSQGVQQSPVGREWTHEEVAMLLRDAMADRSLSVNMSMEQNLADLEMIEEALIPLKQQIDRCREQANVSSSRWAWSFTSVILCQFMLSQYGTYYALSWDIIEPITACVALSDGVAAYYFWLWTGKPWDLNAVRQFFFERRLKKLFKRNHLNYQNYQVLLEAKQQIKNKLYHRL